MSQIDCVTAAKNWKDPTEYIDLFIGWNPESFQLSADEEGNSVILLDPICAKHLKKRINEWLRMIKEINKQ
jgi:hypothetical protein